MYKANKSATLNNWRISMFGRQNDYLATYHIKRIFLPNILTFFRSQKKIGRK